MLLGLVFSLVPRVHSVVLRAFDCFLIFVPISVPVRVVFCAFVLLDLFSYLPHLRPVCLSTFQGKGVVMISDIIVFSEALTAICLV